MTNVVIFPAGRSGGNRMRPAISRQEIAQDFLQIANYLDQTAESTEWPETVREYAVDLRGIAREMREGA